MPRATVAFPFEWTVVEAAHRQASAMGGTADGTAFLLLLDAGGDAIGVKCGEAATTLAGELAEGAAPFVLFDPFDAPEYTWAEWRGLPRAVVERWLGRALHAPDFVSFRDGTTLPAFPETWHVMF